MEQKIIFLADDDRDDAEMFCEALDEINKNIKYVCASNGEDLMLKLNEAYKIPEIIFLDLNMPVMNGWDCLRSLKGSDRYNSIPVIIISTSSHTDEMERAVSLGALCYLIKPNSYGELKDTLEKIVLNIDNLNDLTRKFATDRNIFYP